MEKESNDYSSDYPTARTFIMGIEIGQVYELGEIFDLMEKYKKIKKHLPDMMFDDMVPNVLFQIVTTLFLFRMNLM